MTGNGLVAASLDREILGLVVGREEQLLAVVDAAEAVAPDEATRAAMAELRRHRWRVRRRFPASPALTPAAAPDGWPELVATVTVGATLGRALLEALRGQLGADSPPALLLALELEPAAGPALWAEVRRDGSGVPTAVKVVIELLTRALTDSPALAAQLGREGTLTVFSAGFDALASPEGQN